MLAFPWRLLASGVRPLTFDCQSMQARRTPATHMIFFRLCSDALLLGSFNDLTVAEGEAMGPCEKLRRGCMDGGRRVR